MTNTMESPRVEAAASGDSEGSGDEGELTTLVRRWMAVGTRVQDRVRRENGLRLAPDPVEVEDPDDRVHEERPSVEVPGDGTVRTLGVAPLPRRTTGVQVERPPRVAVLIDAHRVPEDVAIGLLARVSGHGTVTVCRAYADWSGPDLGEWVGRLRQQGLHSFHQFSDDDDQALVAMAIDAVDIARDAGVDEVVLAGDPTSMLPLVHRLHTAGVRVVVVGPEHTPHDVRSACDEYLDAGSLAAGPVVTAGRHRA